jgi:integrase
METGDLLPKKSSDPFTLGDLLERYEREVLPLKRTDSNERYMLRIIRRDPMCTKQLRHILASDFCKYRDSRLQCSEPASVVRHLALLRHALGVAEREWGWHTPLSEILKVTFPRVLIKAISRIDEPDLNAVLRACDSQKNPVIGFAVRLALATAMRRGELLNLRWTDVDSNRGEITIAMSKNGRSRTIPMSPRARELLSVPRSGEKVLPITENSLRLGFERARAKAGVRFRFHDLRHEAISRFFEIGLTIPEVQLMSGHRTISQLSRYSHPHLAAVHKKLAASLS